MNSKTKVLIVGYGNLGQSVRAAMSRYPDLECVGIVTRDSDRVKKTVDAGPIFRSGGLPVSPVFSLYHKEEGWLKLKADVAILCGGSKEDLPFQGPYLASLMNTVDSCDTHDHMGEHVDEITKQPMLGYLRTMDIMAKQTKHTSHVGIGWDPGTFSLMRAYFTAVLGGAKAYAFYGLTEKGGLSLGHSNAIRDNVPGVLDARSYTHARPEAIKLARAGKGLTFLPREMHRRENFVVAEEGADQAAIREAIVSMPNYFAPYDTNVIFISQEQMDHDHPKDQMPHDGLVIAVGEAGVMEFKNTWKSNPDGTAGILLAYVRATIRLNRQGVFGAFSALDTPVKELLEEGVDPVKLI